MSALVFRILARRRVSDTPPGEPGGAISLRFGATTIRFGSTPLSYTLP